jgi:cell division protein FtsQ
VTTTRETRPEDPALDSAEIDDEARHRFSRRHVLLIAVALVVVVVVAGWLFAFSSVFGVKTVTVHAGGPLSTQQITAAADIAPGTPLLRLDTAAVAHRIEALPDVAAATVRASYPSTVVINVTERVAVGAVQLTKGYALVDKTGDQFRTVATQPRQLPLFVVPSGSEAQASGKAVATAAGALSPALRARIASIQAINPNSITVLLTDHRVVRWGSAAQSAAKARILPALLSRPGTQFDVSDPSEPFSR